ncbi:CBS domain-containing protein [Nonlabens marinus]|uniref:Inosine monophosphate dehydrogenase-related protein n=1 Tax=Nonlabens marinus S1-08 TaxID=1454201 RepID=W8VPL3_9FLAO|nr:CBS domain-containing protein [Nonlabens marinus]BAO54555.1 inosine monophosphate dehydrogenase-related protein [Nonlabens marinus S1-08]
MGIKSFMGRRSEEKVDKRESIRVRDYMKRKLITFTVDQNINEVMETILKQRITGGPVVDDQKNLIGIISDTDLMQVIGDSRYHNMPVGDKTVADYMSHQVSTIDAEADIFDAAARFLKTGHRRFPVIEDGKLIGQISRMDVIIAASNLKKNHWR